MSTQGQLLETFTAKQMRGRLEPGRREAYILAGQATFTVRSIVTGDRFTFKVTKTDGPNPVHFVKVLTGPDNESHYEYLGTLFGDGMFRVTRRSRMTDQAPCARAFGWLSTHWENAKAEVWHEGVCGRCGRRLTVPESIESGLGPTCAGR